MFKFQNDTIVALNSFPSCSFNVLSFCLLYLLQNSVPTFWILAYRHPFHKQKARKILSDPSHVSVAYREKRMSNDNIKLFDKFGEQPQCIKDLALDTEYSKLAIAALNCNTFLNY